MAQTIKEVLGFEEDNPLLLIRQAIAKFSTDIRFCIPGIVEAFDSAVMTATVQPAIRESIKNYDTLVPEWVDLPLLLDVPIAFPGNSGYLMTFPLQQGDEVLVVFSDMSIDGFWQNGGVSNQTRLRRHALSDAIAIPCAALSQSKVQAVADFNTSAPELRTAAGDVKLTFVSGGFHVHGNLTASGTITANVPP